MLQYMCKCVHTLAGLTLTHLLSRRRRGCYFDLESLSTHGRNIVRLKKESERRGVLDVIGTRRWHYTALNNAVFRGYNVAEFIAVDGEGNDIGSGVTQRVVRESEKVARGVLVGGSLGELAD